MMKHRSAHRGVVSGAIVGALTLGWFKNLTIVLELPFGWQLVICTAFGALTGLVIGLVYRWRDKRTQSQQQ